MGGVSRGGKEWRGWVRTCHAKRVQPYDVGREQRQDTRVSHSTSTSTLNSIDARSRTIPLKYSIAIHLSSFSLYWIVGIWFELRFYVQSRLGIKR